MLDLGFIHAVRKRIVTMLPEKRQTLFFSATMPNEIAELADTFLTRSRPRSRSTPVATTAERVEQQRDVRRDGAQAGAARRRCLPIRRSSASLVFTRTKHGADRVVRGLEQAGIRPPRSTATSASRSASARWPTSRPAVPRAGRHRHRGSRHRRRRRHATSSTSTCRTCRRAYVHRIGRTARAGAAGVAISFCDDEERAFLRDIEKLTRLKVPVAPLPEGFPAGPVRASGTNPPSRPAVVRRLMPAGTRVTAHRVSPIPMRIAVRSAAGRVAASPPAVSRPALRRAKARTGRLSRASRRSRAVPHSKVVRRSKPVRPSARATAAGATAPRWLGSIAARAANTSWPSPGADRLRPIIDEQKGRSPSRGSALSLCPGSCWSGLRPVTRVSRRGT